MKKSFLIIPLLLAFNFLSFGQSTPIKDNDVEFSVYKEYDKNGNLIRYDSSRVEKGHRLKRHFQFNFLADSLPFKSFKIDSLLSHKNAFLFKDKGLIDSLIQYKITPEMSIFKIDSLREVLPRNFFYIQDKYNEKNVDSILDRHFDRMEKLFEQFFEKNDRTERRKKTL
ncbi:hypothetical protein N9L50_01475 [Flavobacteriaceae bacterium]|nr:hypothetical protein [Flavobacteriaceae bacterium]